MQKVLTAVYLFLMSFGAFAAAREIEPGATAPAELVDVMYVVIFGILFVGMIVVFFAYMWYLERKKKKSE